jgi:hypothetical protein
MSFDELLSNPTYCIFFKRLAEQEFCLKPLLFWYALSPIRLYINCTSFNMVRHIKNGVVMCCGRS